MPVTTRPGLHMVVLALATLIASGCASAPIELPGVSPFEAWTASIDSLYGEGFTFDSEDLSISRVFAPGVMPHRAGPQALVGFDLGTIVRVKIRQSRIANHATLEVRCSEERTVVPVTPSAGARDPAWEAFIADEIIERLRWNRLRLASALPAGGLKVAMAAAMATHGAESQGRWTGSPEGALVLHHEDGRIFAAAGELNDPDGAVWVMVGGPPRFARDDTLEALAVEITQVGENTSRLPLAELPRPRQ